MLLVSVIITMTLVLNVLALLLIGCRVSSTYVTCYQCNTLYLDREQSANCNDPFNAKGVPTCVGLTCMKTYSDCDAIPTSCLNSHCTDPFCQIGHKILKPDLLQMFLEIAVTVNVAQCKSSLRQNSTSIPCVLRLRVSSVVLQMLVRIALVTKQALCNRK